MLQNIWPSPCVCSTVTDVGRASCGMICTCLLLILQAQINFLCHTRVHMSPWVPALRSRMTMYTQLYLSISHLPLPLAGSPAHIPATARNGRKAGQSLISAAKQAAAPGGHRYTCIDLHSFGMVCVFFAFLHQNTQAESQNASRFTESQFE